jgi:hypothetical protein
MYRDFYWDEDGLIIPAILLTFSALSIMIITIRLLISDHNFDPLSYGLGFGLILMTNSAAIGARARSNSRFRMLEQRLVKLEECHPHRSP